MKVQVLTPWIATGDRWRERAKHHTSRHWEAIGLEVVYGESDERPMNRAQARNRAAEASDADVFFFADADMWVPSDQFWESVRLASATGRMVLAYTHHLRLNRWSTEKVYEGQATYQGQTITGCSSGAFAITRDLYERIGGHDERFRGWGYEDRSFQFAAETIAGEEPRLPGLSYHLWHPRGADQARVTAERLEGKALAERYKRAAGVVPRRGIVGAVRDAALDPDAMWAILREDGGPLAVKAHA